MPILKPGERLVLSPEDTIRLEDIRTNAYGERGIHLKILGRRLEKGETLKAASLGKGVAGEREALVKKEGVIPMTAEGFPYR